MFSRFMPALFFRHGPGRHGPCGARDFHRPHGRRLRRSYDVVSFATGTPVSVKEEFTVQWKGADWYLSSAEIQKAFEAAPEKHAPQCRGYCGFAIAKGSTAEGKPEVWIMIDGKPYLNVLRSVQKPSGFMHGENSRKLLSHRAMQALMGARERTLCGPVCMPDVFVEVVLERIPQPMKAYVPFATWQWELRLCAFASEADNHA